ncbi:hypothetical protein JCM10450v2_004377 [Rhodotorula kratochvilovae]
MFSAAASRFSRSAHPGATPSSSRLSPETRQERRLSRITPSEFDSFLNSGETVHLASADAALAAASPSAPPSPDPPTKGASSHGAALPPGLSSEPRGNKVVRRARSLLGSVTEGGSPALATVGPGGGDALEVLDEPRALVTDGAGAYGSDGAYPSSGSQGTGRPKGEKPRLSSISTLLTGSYVHVPFPPVENRPEPATSRSADPNASTTSLGFDFSPMRKRAQSGEMGDGKSTSVPSTPSTDRFASPLPPPVPAIPSAYTPSAAGASPSTNAPSVLSVTRQSPAPRDPRVSRRYLPRLPPTKLIPSPGQTVSAAMLREDSGQSFLSDATHTSAGSSSRRRSMSLSSHKPEVREPEGAASTSGAASARTRRPSTRTEDDQLRRELKRWRLGVDGVLGTAATGGTLTPSPSLGTSSSIGSHSSPQLNQDLADSSGAPSAGSPPLEKRRASVPATTKELPPIVATRAASLPTSSLLPIPSFATTARRPSSSSSAEGSDTPEIRLTPSSRNGSVSSAVTVGPASFSFDAPTLGRASASRQSASSTASSVTEDGIGLGLATITEAAAGGHSRESSSALSPVTPTRESFAAASAGKPLPLQPAGAGGDAGMTTSNRAKGARGSIVALPGLASAGGRLGASAKGKGRKAAEQAADEALSEEELQEKARVLAERAWDEDESFLERRKIAEWLGSAGRVNVAALRHYIDHFDFADLRLDAAFRRLCGKLYLKAETQQVDRILEQFSRRYYDENPQTVYGSADVVHAVSYSLLLLNTDLHVVDTTTRMTRQQFIRNTLEAIHAQTGDSTEVIAPAGLADGPADSSSTVFRSSEASASHRSLDRPQSAKDSPASSSPNLAGSPVITRTGPEGRSDSPARPASVMGGRVNNASLQATLKDMYNAIKSQPIYQISSESNSSSALHLPQEPLGRSSFSLAPGNSPYATWNGNISRAASRRSATSVVSGAPSASSSSAYKRSSIRGMGAFLGASSSLDLVRSQSPTPSTATSISDERWNTAYGPSSSQHHAVPTIGFANSLSHTIIREQREDDDARSEASTVEISDEELALLGAPWAKEGILSRKHYWEATGRRAKDKNWTQAFVVVSQGELKMFRFDGAGGGGSSRGMGGVGGGDWTANASTVGSISLIHALCSAMPPPGYSRERPHCFVLTLPGGGSYFFQAGTPDLVSEWVSTCNYWSARLSKEPLSGGVSNMEYGWSRVDSPQDGADDDDREEIASIRSGHSRRSYASSAFHSSSLGGGGSSAADRIHINEWKPPQVPLVPSNLAEEAQLDALRRHAAIVQRELAHHNTLRAPMLRLFPSRSTTATKALANWERKSQHLLAESVKYRTYVDALAGAVKLRALQRGQKEVARMLESADADADAAADELVAGLSPYETGLSPLATQREGPALLEPRLEGSRRTSRVDSGSAVSIQTSTTNDEYFDSNADTPPATS